MSTASPQSPETLQARRDELLAEAEVARLTREVQALEMLNRRVVPEAFGDLVDRRGYLFDGPSWYQSRSRRISLPEDRKFGDNVPHWQTETEHAEIRGRARWLCTVDEVAIGAQESLTNYVLGDGFTVTAQPKSDDPVDRTLAGLVQHAIDAFWEVNDFEGDVERELFQNLRRDGETILALDHRGGNRVVARQVDPSFLTEPADTRRLEDFLGIPSLEWKYGVAAEHNAPERVHGYFVSWYGDPNDWAWYTHDRLHHVKINVDTPVKRGLSDYYAVDQDLERAEKLHGNALEGGAIQAAIAYVVEHSAGRSGSDIESFVSSRADRTDSVTTPDGGTRKFRQRKVHPGYVPHTPAGTKYHAGPMGQPRGQAYIDLVQAAYRRAGIRWQMPEYLISGDASNNNFASALVAEAPFTKSGESRQSAYARSYARLVWKVIGILAREGVMMGRSLADVKRRVALSVDTPDIAVRDRLEQHKINSDLSDRGLLSDETWATQEGIDLEEERRKGAHRRAMTPTLTESWRGYP